MLEKWIGDKNNGLCLREFESDEDIDELLLYKNGICIMHMEAMSMCTYWFGFYLDEIEVHMNISSKNLKSFIEAKITE